MENYNNQNCTLLFTKFPLRGTGVFSSAELEGTDSFELYKFCVQDLITKLDCLGEQFFICYYPAQRREQFVQWFGRNYSYLPQIGRNTGQRMKNAFISAFAKKFEKVIIISSGGQDIPIGFLQKSIEALERNDSVVGYSPEGGCYLLGFTREGFAEEIFDSVQWDARKVSAEMMSVLTQRCRSVYILPRINSDDMMPDLKSLVLHNVDSDFQISKTV